MSTSAVTTNFRALFTISDVLNELKTTNCSLKIQLCGITKHLPLPCTKPVSLDFQGVQMGSKIEFDLEDGNGNIFGYSEFAVPDAAFKNRDTQVSQQIHFYLNNSDKEFIAAKIFIIFLNTELVQRPKFKNALPKTPSKTPNAPTKSPNKSFSTPQKKRDSSSHKRQKTEERMSYPSVDNSQQDIRDFDDSVRVTNDTFDHSDVIKAHNALYSQVSLDSFLPSSLVQLSTPKETEVPGSFTSKIELESSSGNKPKKTQTTSQPNLDKHRQSEPAVTSSDERRAIINLQKVDQSFTQENTENLYTTNSYAIPTESDALADHFQTFCPSSSQNPKAVGNNLNSPERERLQDRSIEEDTKPGSAKKRRPPSYSPISEKNATSRLSYTEIAFYKAQVEQLQGALLMKDTQITIVNSLKQENEDLRNALAKSEEARKALQLVSSETASELKQSNQELQNQMAVVLAEKKDYFNQNIELQTRVDELEKNFSHTKTVHTATENRNSELSIEVKELRNAKENMEKTQRALESFSNKRDEERTTYMNALAVCQKGLEEAMAKVEKLVKEKKEISEDFQKTQIALIEEKNVSQGLRDELFLAQKSLQNAESYKLVVNSLESEKQELIKILFDKKKGQTELQTLLENVKADFAEKLKENEKQEEKYLGQINALRDNIKNYEGKIGSLTNEIAELKLRVSELITEESALGQLVCLNKDVEQQLEAANQKLARITGEKEKLSEQLLGLCSSQEIASNRILQSEKTASEIRECLNERDDYIASLKKIITELRDSQSRYVPQKDDPIDIALAKFVNSNNNSDKLKFLFFRENSGVYQFGTKRVYIKLEGDKIIIRVGGGYSTIEEFLEQHLQFELEKFLKSASVGTSAKNVIMNRSGGRSSHSRERSMVQGY